LSSSFSTDTQGVSFPLPIRPIEPSLPNTELAEDRVEQIFGGGFADDLAEGVDGEKRLSAAGQIVTLPG